MWNVRGGVLGAVLALGVAGVAGCSAESGGAVAAPLTDLPVVTKAPTPAAVSSSPDPRRDSATAEGAEAAVRRYVRTINDAYLTGEIVGLQGLSTQDCETCDRYMTTVRNVYARGDAVEVMELSPVTVLAAGTKQSQKRSVIVTYDYSGFVIRTAHGSSREVEAPATGVSDRFDLIYQDGAWLVDAVAALQ